jgi:uncharacterized protein (TIGR03084 family)
MKELCNDLAAEYQALDDIIKNIDDTEWDKVTPFYNWTIKEQISHLAYFDWFAKLSASDQKTFNQEMQELAKDFNNLFQNTLKRGLSMTNSQLLEWWRTERNDIIKAYEALDPKTRLPWHIPMSAKSSATARLMETWAHGQDIVDALNVTRTATDRLKHISHLGVATFGWSFKCRGIKVPSESVKVELNSPSGDLWTWGQEEQNGTKNSIAGNAEDFCLVVTQRRHIDDTNLKVNGEVAGQWMLNAQVFAGPSAKGPEPGHFKKIK